MTRAKPPVTPETVDQMQAEIAEGRQSHLESAPGQFFDRTMKAADIAYPGAGGLMRDLNRVFDICNGLATVMRIVSGNDVLADFHDPEDSDSEPPLSRAAVNTLTTMTATVCEWLADDISRTSDRFNGRGEQS
jgi:hypothetical protein